MISDGIKEALKRAADSGTEMYDGKARYSVKLSFDQLVALMEKVDDWNASQNRD